MLRWIALCLLMVTPAPAECPEVITGVEWDGAYTERLLGREGEVTELEATQVLSNMETVPIVQRSHAGVIPLWSSGTDGPMEFVWITPLPSVSDLLPGASFTLAGRFIGMPEEQPVSLDVTVLGYETISVAGCSYEVLKVEEVMSHASGADFPTITFLHVPSLMVLRMDIRLPGFVDTREAVALQ